MALPKILQDLFDWALDPDAAYGRSALPRYGGIIPTPEEQAKITEHAAAFEGRRVVWLAYYEACDALTAAEIAKPRAEKYQIKWDAHARCFHVWRWEKLEREKHYDGAEYTNEEFAFNSAKWVEAPMRKPEPYFRYQLATQVNFVTAKEAEAWLQAANFMTADVYDAKASFIKTIKIESVI